MIEFKIELYKLNYNLIDMSSSFHNQSLYYKDIKSNLPNRKNFIDVDLNVALENDIANKKPLYFLSNDVMEGPPYTNFEMSLSGILPCGSKMIVTIVNITPYVDVAISKPFNQAYKVLSKVMGDKTINFSTIVLVKGKKLLGYSEDIVEFARIKFNTITMRKKFIETFSKKYELYNCDTSCYHRTVSREYHINLASWNLIKKYKIDKSGNFKGDYNIIVNVKDIEGIEEIPDIVIINEVNYSNDILRKDKSILVAFDIEMHSYVPGRVPDGKEVDDDLFMIGFTVHHTNEEESIMNIVITTKYNDPDPEFLTIVCPSEKEVLIMFAMLLASIKPDFVTEFNGGDYDWPAIYNKLDQYNLLQLFREYVCLYKTTEYHLKLDNIKTWIFKSERVKIDSSTTIFPFTYRDFGFIMFDSRVIFRTLYPKMVVTKLNSFLEKNNLPVKDDLSIPTMFEYYRKGDPNDMRTVSHYCFVDCVSLHRLNMKRNVIQDKREVARLSYTSLFDSFYRADSLRVTNLIVSTCLQQNIFSSTLIERKSSIDDEIKKVKFPGAIVLEPKLGTVKSTLSILEYLRLNKLIDDDMKIINKLYYSLINVLYDYIYTSYSCSIVDHTIEDNKLYLTILSEEEKYNHKLDIDNVELFVDYTTEETVNLIIKQINDYSKYVSLNHMQYPISALDFASLYPSIIMTYNITPDSLITNEDDMLLYKEKGYEILDIDFMMNDNVTRIKAWIIRGKRDDEGNIEYYFGLYPIILKRLFDMRKAVKKIFIPLKERKEEIEKSGNTNTKEFQDLMFEYNYYNSKQLGIKVFMNSFYGVLGTEISPLFNLPLAGCTTTNGKRSLIMIKEHIEKQHGCVVYYGDSVIGKTPLVLKINNLVKVMYVDGLYNLFKQKEIYSKNSDKYIIKSDKYNIFVMTDSGWSKVNKIIKHRTNKLLYKVSTPIGIVTVTEDHSLLDNTKKIIKPSDLDGNTKLLCWNRIKSNKSKFIDKHSLYLYYYYHNSEYDGNHLTIEIDEYEATKLILSYLDCFSSTLKFTAKKISDKYYIYNSCVNMAIIKTLLDKTNIIIKSLLIQAILVDATISDDKLQFKNINSNNRLYKEFKDEIIDVLSYGNKNILKRDIIDGIDDIYIIPHKSLYSMSYQCILLFLEMIDVYNKSFRSQLQLQSIIVLLKMVDQGYYIMENADGSYNLSKSNITNYYTKIKHITYVHDNEYNYVYDLETETSHFAAGVGQLVVHNTDSLYFACNKNEFVEYDRDYYCGNINKLDYSTKLVEKTFKLTHMIQQDVNNTLYKDNGQRYLNMSYEEVLFPGMWISKKKYFGVPHEKIINFFPEQLFIKGLDITKRGVSQVLVKTCFKLLHEVTNIYNIYTMRELIGKYIEYIFTNKWDANDFIKSSKYNPNKNNPSVQKFVKRMKELNKEIPKPHDRFKYVIAKKYPYTYDIKGRQTVLGVGDKMEYITEITENGMEIDLSYYFNGEIVGQFGKYILYDSEFHIYIDGEIDETHSLKKSKKYIESLTKQYLSDYTNKGKIFKDLYRNVSKLIKKSDNMDKKLDTLSNISNDIINDNTSIQNHIDSIIKKKYKIVNIAMNIINRLEIEQEIDIYDLKKIYNTKDESFYRVTLKDLYQKILVQKSLIKTYINKNNKCKKYLNKKEDIIANAVASIKNNYNFESILIGNVEKLEEVVDTKDIEYYVSNNILSNEITVDESDENDVDEFNSMFNDLIRLNVLYKVHEEVNNMIMVKIKNKINKNIR